MEKRYDEISLAEFIFDFILYCIHFPSIFLFILVEVVMGILIGVFGFELLNAFKVIFIIGFADITLFILMYTLDQVLSERRELS